MDEQLAYIQSQAYTVQCALWLDAAVAADNQGHVLVLAAMLAQHHAL